MRIARFEIDAPGNELPAIAKHASGTGRGEKSGDAFGVVVIETDLTEIIVNILGGLSRRSAEIYVTDPKGNVWVSSQPGIGVEPETPTMSDGSRSTVN